ncbi:MAG: hypothetical protein AAFN79_06930 [Pseudomonadota bacterium]
MLKAMAGACALALAAGAAQADTLKLYDETGGELAVNTADISGCKMVFDSQGNAFEFCRLEKIELRPEASTRMRPGAAKGPARDSVIYAKHAADPTNR